MRIAINTRLLLPGRLEGIGRFTHEVAQRLVVRRPDDEFLFFFDRPYDEQFIYSERVQPLVLSPPSRHPVLWYWWFEWSVVRQLRRQQVDLFLSMDNYCSLRAKTPTVMVTHDIAHVHYPAQIPTAARHYYNYFVPRYLARAEGLVTVSEFCRQDIQQQYGISGDKIGVSCNAASPAFRPVEEMQQVATRKQYSQGEAYFFYLGAVHPRKNLERLMLAFDEFKEQSGSAVKLLIGGRFAWQTGNIKAVYEGARYREDITFLGYVPDEELPLLVGSALALTYVSLFEGFGVPLLEAMQAGVPVLTSDVSSLPEVAGDAALLVPPDDISIISKALLRLYEDAALREQLIARGYPQSAKFNWEAATDAVEEMMERVMKGGRLATPD